MLWNCGTDLEGDKVRNAMNPFQGSIARAGISLSKCFYTINCIKLLFCVVLTDDLLEERRVDNVTINLLC